jgi:plastocyanin
VKRWLTALLVVLTLAATSLPSVVAYAAEKAKTQMIMITPSGVSPSTATVDKGTKVVWVNNASSANILFSRGKEVAAASVDPSRFALDSVGKYNSGDLPQGGIASLSFIGVGKYPYDVVDQTSGGARIGSGTVIVK